MRRGHQQVQVLGLPLRDAVSVHQGGASSERPPADIEASVRVGDHLTRRISIGKNVHAGLSVQ